MCICFSTTFYRESERIFFVRASACLDKTHLAGKKVENPKSVVIGYILLKSYEASFEQFTILLKESNKFNLHLKESLLIKRD